MSNSGYSNIKHSRMAMRTLLTKLLMASLVLLAGLQPLAAAETAPDFIQTELGPGTQLLGSGTLRWFGIRVYDAKLWVSNGRYQADQPHALQLTYGHDFRAEELAKEGGKQLRKQGVDETRSLRWQALMQQAFTDVKAGDSLTAILRADQSLAFYSNGKATTVISDTEFSQHFLDIWLGSKTTEPKLRLKLLGQE